MFLSLLGFGSMLGGYWVGLDLVLPLMLGLNLSCQRHAAISRIQREFYLEVDNAIQEFCRKPVIFGPIYL